MTITIDKKPKRKVFNTFHQAAHTPNIYSTLYYKRNRRIEEADKFTKVAVGAGSVVATILPMVYFARKQNGLKKFIDLFKLEYKLKEVITLSTCSIAGGVLSGILADKKSNKKRKIQEGVFQFMNATVPTAIAGGLLEAIAHSKKYKESRLAQIGAIVTGLAVGMPIAAKLSNLINDPKDKEPDRKITLKDSIINMDDALGALVIAKFPLVEATHLDKAMPAIFAWCGYRAGQSN